MLFFTRLGLIWNCCCNWLAWLLSDCDGGGEKLGAAPVTRDKTGESTLLRDRTFHEPRESFLLCSSSFSDLSSLHFIVPLSLTQSSEPRTYLLLPSIQII